MSGNTPLLLPAQVGSLFPSEQYEFDNLSRMTTRSIGTNAYSYAYTDTAHIDAPTSYHGNGYHYDANGDQLTGTVNGTAQARTYDQERHLVQITSASTTSTFIYDGNDQRIIQNVTSSGKTTSTLYTNGYEETLNSGSTPPYIVYYTLGGKAVGMRRANQPGINTNGQFRVVGDQLGSTTLIIDTATVPNVTQREYYKPFGEVAFSSGSSRTDKGFTGQRLDSGSGLMYYGARYYDPALSYFISPDSVVPGSAGGSEENSKLTVDFHESGFLSSATGENLQIVEKGFWFQLSGDDRQKAKSPWGPSDAQSLNRYSYTQSNPLTNTDPTGHLRVYRGSQANDFLFLLKKLIAEWSKVASDQQGYSDLIAKSAGLLGSSLIQFLQGVIGSADTSFANGMLELLKWMANYVSWINGNDPELAPGDYVEFTLLEDFNGSNRAGFWWSYYMVATISAASGVTPPDYATDREHSLASHAWFGGSDGADLFWYLAGQERSTYDPRGFWTSTPLFPAYLRVTNPCDRSKDFGDDCPAGTP